MITNGMAQLIGNEDLFSESWTALFCSSKCPGSLILQAYDLSIVLQKENVPIASGFQSPIEKEALTIALRGEQKILIALARGLDGMRIPKEYRKPLEEGRLLLASIFPGKVKRPSAETAERRNHFVAGLAERILVVHAAPGGRLEGQCREWLGEGKWVETLESEYNRNLLEMGAGIVGKE